MPIAAMLLSIQQRLTHNHCFFAAAFSTVSAFVPSKTLSYNHNGATRTTSILLNGNDNSNSYYGSKRRITSKTCNNRNRSKRSSSQLYAIESRNLRFYNGTPPSPLSTSSSSSTSSETSSETTSNNNKSSSVKEKK
jgi:hypothetical protein